MKQNGTEVRRLSSGWCHSLGIGKTPYALYTMEAAASTKLNGEAWIYRHNIYMYMDKVL